MSRIVLIFLSINISVFAFRITPIELNFNLKKKGFTQTMTLDNPLNKDIPIEVTIFTRKMAIDGKETRKPSDDFVVFPQQMILKGKQQRNIRVTYVGKKKLQREKAYRIHVRQVPVRLEKEAGDKATMNLNFAYEYFGSLYAIPGEVGPELVVTKMVRPTRDSIKVIIENRGKGHALLTQYKPFIINKMGKEIAILDEVLTKDYHRVNILAGGKREFTMNLPKKSPSKIKGIKLRKAKIKKN